MIIKDETNQSKKKDFESIDEIIKKKFEKKGPVYAKHEFQEYGVRLSEILHDLRHKALYIKFSKEKSRAILEEAKNFAKDYNTKSVNRGKLFMWKLKDLEDQSKTRRRGKSKPTASF